MTGLAILAIVQLAMIVLMIFLVSKLFALLRSGAPLINWRRSSAERSSADRASVERSPVEQPPVSKAVAEPPAEAPVREGRTLVFKLPLPRKAVRVAEAGASEPAAPGTEPVTRSRSRRLLTLSELEAVSNRAAAQFPEDYYAAVEARLESLFQSYLDQDLSLGEYLEAIRKERALTQATLRNGLVRMDPALRAEAERAAAAIDWCLDWATGQLEQTGNDLAA